MRLKEQSQDFRTYLERMKSKTALHSALSWYPWPSLAQFDIVDEMLDGDTGALLQMAGHKPVLDVGCGDGDIAFFMESLGKRAEVVDNAPTNYNAMYGVHALKEALQSAVTIQAADIDTQPNFPRQHYGLTIMLGVLYHLKNPYLVLEALAKCSDHIILSTRFAQLAPDRKTGYGGNPVAYLVEEDELNRDYTNYWIFTQEGLKRIVRRAGWDITHYSAKGPVETSDPVTPKGDARAFLIAKSRLSGRIEGARLVEGWHDMEEDHYRWTARRFSIEVEVPKPVSSAGFEFRFYLPEVLIAQHPSVTLNVRMAGAELPPITCSSTGDFVHTIRLGALEKGWARIDFEVSCSVGNTQADPRELGILVKFNGPSPFQLTL